MIKPKLGLVLVIAILITTLTGQIVLADDPPVYDTTVTLYPGNVQITIVDNKAEVNKTLEVAPYVENGVTFIPLRGVLEALGAKINWVPETKQIEVNIADNNIILTMNSNTALVNKRNVSMDKPVQSINNRTMIPIRFVAENMGCIVNWDGTKNEIDIINKTIASAKGISIGYGEFDKALAWAKYLTEKQYGSGMWTTEAENGKTWAEIFPQIVLNELITGEIVEAQAYAQNMQVSDDEINSEMAKYQKLINEDQELAKVVKQHNISDWFLRGMARESLIGAKYKSNYAQSINITDNEMNTYYDNHKSDYTAEKVKASHILIKTHDDSTAKGQEYNQEAYQKALDILKRAQAGEDFAQLAKQYSEDSGTALNGGEMGYFKKGQMVPEFEQAAFSLKAGQISDLVKTIYGYHIIKVEDHTTEVSTYDQVKDSIKNAIINGQYEQHISELITQMGVKVYGAE